MASDILVVLQSSSGVQPGATGADNVVASFPFPASAFDTVGRGYHIEAHGSFAATANNKQCKIIFNPTTAVVGSTVGAGGTSCADTGTVTTNGGGWRLVADIFKTAANAQLVCGYSIVGPASVAAGAVQVVAPAAPTATDTGTIWLAVTGNATTAATDIVFRLLTVTQLH